MCGIGSYSRHRHIGTFCSFMFFILIYFHWYRQTVSVCFFGLFFTISQGSHGSCSWTLTWSECFVGLFHSRIDTYKHILLLTIDHPSTTRAHVHMYYIWAPFVLCSSVSSFMTMQSLSNRYRGTHAQPVAAMEGPLLDKTKRRSRDMYTYS